MDHRGTEDARAMAGVPAAAKQFNKVAVHLAGHRFLPLWALLRHRGRRSGTPYATPVAVIPTETTFVIGLPWGPGTDWVRSVRAAGRCTIRWKGVDYECTAPTFVDKGVALAAAHGLTRRILQRGSFPTGSSSSTAAPPERRSTPPRPPRPVRPAQPRHARYRRSDVALLRLRLPRQVKALWARRHSTGCPLAQATAAGSASAPQIDAVSRSRPSLAGLASVVAACVIPPPAGVPASPDLSKSARSRFSWGVRGADFAALVTCRLRVPVWWRGLATGPSPTRWPGTDDLRAAVVSEVATGQIRCGPGQVSSWPARFPRRPRGHGVLRCASW